VIFGNIRKSVMFMLCTNVSEVIAVAAASVTGAPLPLLPLQILYLNMLTDVFPALALGVGEGSEDVMRRSPRRPGESIMTAQHWRAVGGLGLCIAACVLSALAAGLLWLGKGELEAVTMSFLTLGFAKLWFVYNLRDSDSHWLQNTILRNRWIWGSIGLCVVLLVAAVYIHGLSSLLRTQSIGWMGWMLVLVLSALPVLLGQASRLVSRRTDPST
jgi:Ca2+-transporting ATPase